MQWSNAKYFHPLWKQMQWSNAKYFYPLWEQMQQSNAKYFHSGDDNMFHDQWITLLTFVSLCEQFVTHLQSSILLWQKAETLFVMMQFIEDLLQWRRKTFLTCFTIPLTAWMILLCNAIISHWWLTANLHIRNDVKLTQWTFCWMDPWQRKTYDHYDGKAKSCLLQICTDLYSPLWNSWCEWILHWIDKQFGMNNLLAA